VWGGNADDVFARASGKGLLRGVLFEGGILIFMQARCSKTGEPYKITDREEAFAKGIAMPHLPLSPTERFRQLMATRNEWKLYPRTCNKTGEKILSAYAKDSPYLIYKNDVWWGDSWDAVEYGREFDFSRPFFDQFYELQLKVPREGTSVFQCENCDYNSHIRQSKNCYLNSLVVRAEDMHYCYWMVDVEDTLDSCYHISGKSSLCYECVDFGNCYNCIALQESYNCNECSFSYELRSCDHCIFCSNISNKSYHIANKPCSKEEYELLRAKLINGSSESWKSAYGRFLDVCKNAVHRSAHNTHCENVSGDHIFDSKNCFECFDGDHAEDCTHSISLNNSKDIHSCYSAGWTQCEKLWNCAVSRGCSDMAFCRYMWFCNDMRYCDSCQSSKHCFGCIGLRRKEYCILNKQYSKEEYESMKKKIIEASSGSWGKFWPYKYLPFAYNESAAMDFFPLTKEEAVAQGFRWREENEEKMEVTKIIPADQLPDAISDIPDDVLNWAIRCSISGKPFRIIKQELDFYRRMNLPLPRAHPTERHKWRMSLRNPYRLFDRPCGKCEQKIQTTYAPERPEVVYCEDCYLKEVY